MRKIPLVKLELANKNKLYLKVTVPQTTIRKFKNLDTIIEPNDWDKKTMKVKAKVRDADIINRAIWNEKYAIEDMFAEDVKNGTDFTEDIITMRLAGIGATSKHDFYVFALDQIAIKNYSPETRRTYESEVTKMKAYSPTLTFADITYKWLQRYENHMREKLGNHGNTVWKSLKFLNTMLNRAIDVGGLIKENPMKNYDRGKYRQGIPVYIEWDEAQKIHKALKEKPMTDIVRLTGWYAMLSYYSGLRFADAVKFDYSQKVIQDTKTKRLLLYAQKNGEIVSIKFNTYIDEVVNQIKDKPIKITNQEYNSNLKMLIGIAEVSKTDISSHSFRHGFAMRNAELNTSIEDVQKLMGHNKRSSTEIYYRIKNSRLDEAMGKW